MCYLIEFVQLVRSEERGVAGLDCKGREGGKEGGREGGSDRGKEGEGKEVKERGRKEGGLGRWMEGGREGGRKGGRDNTNFPGRRRR